MALYEQLCAADVLGPINRLLDEGRLKAKIVNGELKVKLERMVSGSGPWINTRVGNDRLCAKWLGIYFKFYRFIPKGCRHCWKVVWTGKTIEQLFKIKEIQKEMDLVSKCGIERRPDTGKLGHYQGFWYTPLDGGLKGARELWRQVKDRLMKEPLLAPVELVLKRGCTEMEHQWHPTDRWDELAAAYMWDRDEALCDSIFEDEYNFWKEPTVVQVSVMKTWIEYAAAHKDPTVEKFCDKSIVHEVLRYDKSIHSERDYPGLEMGEDRQRLSEENAGAQEEGTPLDERGPSASRANEAIITEF